MPKQESSHLLECTFLVFLFIGWTKQWIRWADGYTLELVIWLVNFFIWFFEIVLALDCCCKRSGDCLLQKAGRVSAMRNNWTEGWHPCLCSLWSVVMSIQLSLLCFLTTQAFCLTWRPPSSSGKFILGDNFFKSASYTIEALCAAAYKEEKEYLRAVETQILTKRVEMSKFESEYREVWKHKKSFIWLYKSLFLLIFTYKCWLVLAQVTILTGYGTIYRDNQ